MKRSLNLFILVTFLFNMILPYGAQANVLPYMPAAGTMISTTSNYDLPRLVGMKFTSDNPFEFTFILSGGNIDRNETAIRAELAKIHKYFLAALTIPEQDLWVNLSPYEQGRIAPDILAQTELGKDLLGEDYVLKQLAASLTYPESETGKKYWDEINNVGARSPRPLSGRGNPAPTQTFNKVWIIPGKIKILEAKDRMAIDQATLKVMTDADYLASQNNQNYKLQIANGKLSNGNGNMQSAMCNLQSVNAFKQHILPSIEQEVNQGKHFSQFRQAYSALIMAAWFKNKLKNTILNESFLNKSKIQGADTQDKTIREKIYNEYLKAFQQGAYNIIKSERVGANDYSPVQRITKRAYFSGGAVATNIDERVAGGTTLADGKAVDADLPQAAIAEEVKAVPAESRVEQIFGMPESELPYSRIELEAAQTWFSYRLASGYDADDRHFQRVQSANRTVEMILHKTHGSIYPSVDKLLERAAKFVLQEVKLSAEKSWYTAMEPAFEKAVCESRLVKALGHEPSAEDFKFVWDMHVEYKARGNGQWRLIAPPDETGWFSREKTSYPPGIIKEMFKKLASRFGEDKATKILGYSAAGSSRAERFAKQSIIGQDILVQLSPMEELVKRLPWDELIHAIRVGYEYRFARGAFVEFLKNNCRQVREVLAEASSSEDPDVIASNELRLDSALRLRVNLIRSFMDSNKSTGTDLSDDQILKRVIDKADLDFLTSQAAGAFEEAVLNRRLKKALGHEPSPQEFGRALEAFKGNKNFDEMVRSVAVSAMPAEVISLPAIEQTINFITQKYFASGVLGDAPRSQVITDLRILLERLRAACDDPGNKSLANSTFTMRLACEHVMTMYSAGKLEAEEILDEAVLLAELNTVLGDAPQAVLTLVENTHAYKLDSGNLGMRDAAGHYSADESTYPAIYVAQKIGMLMLNGEIIPVKDIRDNGFTVKGQFNKRRSKDFQAFLKATQDELKRKNPNGVYLTYEQAKEIVWRGLAGQALSAVEQGGGQISQEAAGLVAPIITRKDLSPAEHAAGILCLQHIVRPEAVVTFFKADQQTLERLVTTPADPAARAQAQRIVIATHRIMRELLREKKINISVRNKQGKDKAKAILPAVIEKAFDMAVCESRLIKAGSALVAYRMPTSAQLAWAWRVHNQFLEEGKGEWGLTAPAGSDGTFDAGKSAYPRDVVIDIIETLAAGSPLRKERGEYYNNGKLMKSKRDLYIARLTRQAQIFYSKPENRGIELLPYELAFNAVKYGAAGGSITPPTVSHSDEASEKAVVLSRMAGLMGEAEPAPKQFNAVWKLYSQGKAYAVSLAAVNIAPESASLEPARSALVRALDLFAQRPDEGQLKKYRDYAALLLKGGAEEDLKLIENLCERFEGLFKSEYAHHFGFAQEFDGGAANQATEEYGKAYAMYESAQIIRGMVAAASSGSLKNFGGEQPAQVQAKAFFTAAINFNHFFQNDLDAAQRELLTMELIGFAQRRDSLSWISFADFITGWLHSHLAAGSARITDGDISAVSVELMKNVVKAEKPLPAFGTGLVSPKIISLDEAKASLLREINRSVFAHLFFGEDKAKVNILVDALIGFVQKQPSFSDEDVSKFIEAWVHGQAGEIGLNTSVFPGGPSGLDLIHKLAGRLVVNSLWKVANALTNGGFSLQNVGEKQEVDATQGEVKFSRDKALTEWKNILGVELMTVSLKF